MPALLCVRCGTLRQKKLLLLLLCCHVVRGHHTASLGALITEVFVLLTRAVEWCMAGARRVACLSWRSLDL